jgi:hypothetical protein
LTEYSDSKNLSLEIDYWNSVSGFNSKNILLNESTKTSANTIDSTDTICFELDPPLTHSLLKDTPRAYNTKINDILLTALSISYYEWSGENKFRIDLEAHGREELFEDTDLSRTVGWFTTIFR